MSVIQEIEKRTNPLETEIERLKKQVLELRQQVKSVDLADVVNCASCKYQFYGTTEPCRSCKDFANHTPK